MNHELNQGEVNMNRTGFVFAGALVPTKLTHRFIQFIFMLLEKPCLIIKNSASLAHFFLRYLCHLWCCLHI